MEFFDKIFSRLRAFLPVALLIFLSLSLVSYVAELIRMFTVSDFFAGLINLALIVVVFISSAGGASKSLKRYGLILFLILASAKLLNCVYLPFTILETFKFVSGSFSIYYIITIMYYLIFVAIGVLTIMEIVYNVKRFENAIKSLITIAVGLMAIAVIFAIIASAIYASAVWYLFLTPLLDACFIVIYYGIREDIVKEQ